MSVNSINSLSVPQSAAPIREVAFKANNEDSQPQKTGMSGTSKFLLTAATLGAITYGIIRYRNAKALKPFLETVVKETKNGGKLTTELSKVKVKNPDGTLTDKILKSTKIHTDKDGKKLAEVIQDMSKGERYTVRYDKDGNVVKNVISRMSKPVANSKSTIEQKMVYDFARTEDSIVTNSKLIDYSTKKPVELFSGSVTKAVKKAEAAVETTLPAVIS